MRPELDAPIINPGRKFFRIPGLEIPRSVGANNGMAFGVSALLLGGLFFLATKSALAFVLMPISFLLNILFATLFAIHSVRCKSWRFTPAYERELKSLAAGLAPLSALAYSIGYIFCYAMGGNFYLIPLGIGAISAAIRWRELKEGAVHWFCYDNIPYPGTLQHIAGPKPFRVILFYCLAVLGFTGNMLFFLPFCTIAFAVLCTCPGDEGMLGRWQATYQRMQESAMKEVREALLIGWLFDGTPVMVPLRCDRGHWEIFGMTRSGKSSFMLAPKVEATGSMEKTSLLLINMKPDKHELQGACEATGRPTHVITNKRGYWTRTLLLFDQDFWAHLDDSERGGLLLQVLNLDYADVYGENYFREMMEFLATRAQRGPSFRTMKEFVARLKELIDDKRNVPATIRRDAVHLYAIIERLSHSQILNNTSVPTFQLSDLFRTPQNLHMHLDGSHGRTIIADIARIALCCLPAAAMMVPAEERCNLVVIVDEVQRIASKNLEILFQQCASLGILLDVSCQSPANLESPKLKLAGTVSKNSAVRMDFTFTTGDEIKEVQATCGTTVDYVRSRTAVTRRGTRVLQPCSPGPGIGIAGDTITTFSDDVDVTDTEFLAPRLSANSLRLISSRKNAALLTIGQEDELNDFGGLPVFVELEHHISIDEYVRRCRAPFPKGEHTVLNVGRPQEPEAPAAVPITPPPPPAPIETVEPKKGRRKKGA